MKKLLMKLSGLLGLAIILVPMTAAATPDRIVQMYSDNSLWMKEGPVSAQWSPVATKMSPFDVTVSGSRVAFYDANDPQSPVYLKEPNWNSPWVKVFSLPNSDYYITDVKTCQLSNGQYRLVVGFYDSIANTDKLIIKDGPPSAGWWTLDLAGENPINYITCAADRVGVVFGTGVLLAKQLTPGQFTNPDNVAWITEANNVSYAAMTANRLAYIDSSDINNYVVYAKDGPLNAPWFGNHGVIYDNVSFFAPDNLRLGGSRLCVIKQDTWVECKEGGLGNPSVLTFAGADSLAVSNDRIAAVYQDGVGGPETLSVLEGSIYGANSGWQKLATGVGGFTTINLNNWVY